MMSIITLHVYLLNKYLFKIEHKEHHKTRIVQISNS